MKWHKIKNKLIIAFLIPVLLMISLGVISYLQSSMALRKNYETSLVRTIESKGEYLGLVTKNIENEVLKLLTDSNFIKYYTAACTTKSEEEDLQKALYKTFVKVATSNDFVNSFNVLSAYGKSYATGGTLSTKHYEEYLDSEENKALAAGGKQYEWNGYHLFLDEATGSEGAAYVMSYTRQFIQGEGYIIVDISKEKLVNSLEELSGEEGNIVGFIAPDGRETLLGTKETSVFGTFQVLKDFKASEETSGYSYVDYNGAQQLLVYSKIRDTGAMLTTLIPKNAIIAQAETIKRLTFIMVIIAGIVAILIGSLMAEGIEKNIKNMQKALSKAAEGDLTVEIKGNRKDEFGQLSKSITGMLTDMKGLIHKTTDVGEEIVRSSKDMSHISNVLLTASKEINCAIGEIEKGVILQAEDSSKCLRQMGDLSDRIEGLYKSTGEIETFTGQTKIVVEKGVGLVDNLTQKVKETIGATSSVIEDVEELSKASAAIESIVGVINGIAEQTNLLSLNASIEAARAGEAGKGFAVIAQEVNKLAVQSAEGARKIEELLGNIAVKTKETVKAVKQTEVIASSQEEALKLTVEIFNDINSNIKNLVINLGEVSKDIKEIEVVKDDTLSAIGNITAVSQQTAVSSQEVQNTADKQLEAVEQLGKAAELLDQDAKKLEQAISHFQI